MSLTYQLQIHWDRIILLPEDDPNQNLPPPSHHCWCCIWRAKSAQVIASF